MAEIKRKSKNEKSEKTEPIKENEKQPDLRASDKVDTLFESHVPIVEKTEVDDFGALEIITSDGVDENGTVFSSLDVEGEAAPYLESGQKTEIEKTTTNESSGSESEKTAVQSEQENKVNRRKGLKRGKYKKSEPSSLIDGEPLKQDEVPETGDVKLKKDKVTIQVSGYLMLTMIDMLLPGIVLKLAGWANVKPKGMTAKDLRLDNSEKKDLEPVAAEVAKMIFSEMEPLSALFVLLSLTYAGKFMAYESM